MMTDFMCICACTFMLGVFVCVWSDDVQFEAATEDEVCKVLKKVSLSESNFKQLKDMVKHRLTASGRDHYK